MTKWSGPEPNFAVDDVVISPDGDEYKVLARMALPRPKGLPSYLFTFVRPISGDVYEVKIFMTETLKPAKP